MTYYWIGPVVAIHQILSFLTLVIGSEFAQRNLSEYILSLFPLAILVLLIRQVALRTWRHPSVAITLFWRAVVLIYATWPLYTLAWVMALARVPLGFRLTPKSVSDRAAFHLVMPQIISVVALACALSYSYLVRHTSPPGLLVLFVLGQIALQVLFLLGWARGAGNSNIPEIEPDSAQSSIQFSQAAFLKNALDEIEL